MPPSGFNRKAINGLLLFVREAYETTLATYEGESQLSEEEFLQKTVGILEQAVEKAARDSPLAISDAGIAGLTYFATECYKDLANEIILGRDKHGRPVYDSQAMKKEITQLSDYLRDFTL